MNEYKQLADKNYQDFLNVFKDKFDIWTTHVYLSWQWWFGVAITLLSILIFIKFRKQDSTARLLLAGFFTALIAAFIDTLGNTFGWYDYNYDVIPATPSYLPYDFFLIPVTMVLTIQYKPNTNPFLKGLIYAAATAFIGLPLLDWIGVYNPMNWNLFYSFLIMFVLFIAANSISKLSSFDKI